MEQTTLEETAQLMIEKQQDHIFIVDSQEKLIGVISRIDIVKKINRIMILMRRFMSVC
jgi:predicted transcriptional regulator